MYNNLLKFFVILILIGCAQKKESDTLDTSVGELGVDFVDKTKTLNWSPLAVDPKVGGVFFGELEIVAYDYRPGEAIQRWETNNGFNGPDWSYWPILNSGHDKAREIVIKPNSQVDISALNWVGNPPQDKDFIKEVGQFEIDVFEVYVYRMGVIYDNQFHNDGIVANSDPLYRYPEFASLPRFTSYPGIGGFAGFPGHGASSDTTYRINSFSILFIRDDWFPEPVLVYWSDRSSISHASKTLTTQQTDILTSLTSQTTQRRSLDHAIIIPYSKQSVALKKTKFSETKQVRSSSQAQVTFDLSDIIDPSSTFSGDSSVVKFKRDVNNVPLGLELSFRDK